MMNRKVFVSILLLGASAVAGAILAGKMVEPPSGIAVVSQTYRYRTLATSYDSVEVRCTFGEICIPHYGGGDTLHVEWQQMFLECNGNACGLDSSEAYLNTPLASRPFSLTERTELSLFRIIMLFTADDSAPCRIPDTTAWTMELWNLKTGSRIATIDSIGICRTSWIPPTVFPPTFGFEGVNTYGTVTVPLGSYARQGVTDAYVVLRVKNWAPDAHTESRVFDNQTFNAKFSETLLQGS